MKLFAGQSNQTLAQKIADSLQIPMGDTELTRFANGEMRVWVKDQVHESQAIVVQSLSMPVEEHLVEFAFLCDALHRQGVHDIIAVIPWLGYSKQDKVFRSGESLSVKVIAKMLQVVPLKRLYTFDLHNLAILGFFDTPVTNLSAAGLFLQYFKSHTTDKTVIVAPDAGAVKTSTAFANELDVPVVYMDKKRDLATGQVKVVGMSRSVEGAEVIIIDDMIVTGSTLIETAKHLKDAGAAKVSVGATHHLYVPGAQKKIEESGIDEIVVSDTVEPKIKSKKLVVLSVASLVAHAISGHD